MFLQRVIKLVTRYLCLVYAQWFCVNSTNITVLWYWFSNLNDNIFLILERWYTQRLYEKCDCKEQCAKNSYLASLSQAAFPSQPILSDIQKNFGYSEKLVRSVSNMIVDIGSSYTLSLGPFGQYDTIS